jgi:hypothetical protein
LREKLVALVGEKPRFSYRRLHLMLKQSGERVNHKRVWRVYRGSGGMRETEEAAGGNLQARGECFLGFYEFRISRCAGLGAGHNDNVYVEYVGGGYYLYNPRHSGIRITLNLF